MDKEWERIILIFGAPIAAAAILPTLLPAVRDRVCAFLLEWSIVVPQAQARLRIPLTDVGLDDGRLLIGAGLLVVVGALLVQRVRSGGPAQG